MVTLIGSKKKRRLKLKSKKGEALHKTGHIFVYTSLFLFLFVSNLLALSGKVVSVADGDTITVLTHDKTQVKIRFYGIDTPEREQDFARASTAHLKTFLTPHVTVQVIDQDRYGRSIGLVFNEVGLNLNQQMVQDGFAWVYTQYCRKSFCSDWQRLEKEAMQSKTGLWRDPDPVAPWQWRQGKRSTDPKSKTVSASFSGNTKSQVAHKKGCKHYQCKNCTKQFQSASAAKNAGFRLCLMCN